MRRIPWNKWGGGKICAGAVAEDGDLEIWGIADFPHYQNLQHVERSCKYEDIVDMGEGYIIKRRSRVETILKRPKGSSEGHCLFFNWANQPTDHQRSTKF
jgi:hypothetical protein